MKDYQISNISSPGQNDILCGRGGGTNAHSGNIKFRKLVAAHKLRYLAASKSDKPSVARDVVKEWRSMDPPGRFLAKMDAPNGVEDKKNVFWYDVGDKKAREKASQCLRERNGAANEAVQALVKTVTASGEACPEDYATLMNKAAMIKTQNELTLQQQNEMMKMQNMQTMYANNGIGPMQSQDSMRNNNNHGGNNNNIMHGGGGNNMMNGFCQEAFEPISLEQSAGGMQGGGMQGGGMRSQDNWGASTEDDMIEAEIQRLLQQKQRQLMNNRMQGNRMQGNNASSQIPSSTNSYSNNSNNDTMFGNRGNSNGSGNGSSGDSNQYMGEESVMREYQKLMQQQRELNMMAGNIGGNMGGNMSMMEMQMKMNMMNNMNGNMNMMSGNQMMNFSNNNMQYGSSNSNSGNNGMNQDAAQNYMQRLRMSRNGMDNGMSSPEMPYSQMDMQMKRNMMNNMNNDNMMSGNKLNDMPPPAPRSNSGINDNAGNNKAKDNFTIEEYQASLQEFLSHNEGPSANNRRGSDQPKKKPSFAQRSESNMTNATAKAGNRTGGVSDDTFQCLQVPTNLGDGRRSSMNRRGSLRSVDDMDIPTGRNTFKSVESIDRPSFQSMDDLDIRGTFKSVDTMDLMSIGNSINEIMENDPEMRQRYQRRLSANSRYGKSGVNEFGGGGGPKKTKKSIDSRLVSSGDNTAGASMPGVSRYSVQTKDKDGPSSGYGGRGSQLSIKNWDFDGLDDASRMSFGNM